jgi:hypothetical protein
VGGAEMILKAGEFAEYKWFELWCTASTGKTLKFDVVTKDFPSTIGEIKWYAPWRKYSFFPSANTVFEVDCLKDIVSIISELMEARKSVTPSTSQKSS